MVGMTEWIFHDTNFTTLRWVWGIPVYAIWQVHQGSVYSWLVVTAVVVLRRFLTVKHSKSMSFVFDLIWRFWWRLTARRCFVIILLSWYSFVSGVVSIWDEMRRRRRRSSCER